MKPDENLSRFYESLTKRERQMLVFLYNARFSRRPSVHEGMLPFISYREARRAVLVGIHLTCI